MCYLAQKKQEDNKMNNNVCCEAKVEKPMCVADYEHERKEFDPEVYWKCKEYLDKVRN